MILCFNMTISGDNYKICVSWSPFSPELLFYGKKKAAKSYVDVSTVLCVLYKQKITVPLKSYLGNSKV